MKLLVAFERSGAVRRAFESLGHEAWSCDLEPADDGSRRHIQGDALDAIFSRHWDLVVAHPPYTYLAVSGNRWYAGTLKRRLALAGIEELMCALDACADAWALENPIGVISSAIRKPDQIIQPWQFGHPETKATCLWLSKLPKLVPTNIVEGREQRVWEMGPSSERQRLRSQTYAGIAAAMAEQWSGAVR